MKRRLLLLALIAVMSVTCVMAEKFVAVKKGGVNLREQPNTTSAVVGKATKGMTLILLGNSNGWSHVKDVVEGKEAYVSSALVTVLPEYSTPDAEQLVRMPDSEVGFENAHRGKTSETISLWRFWKQAPEGNVVMACLSEQYNDVSGRSQTFENYYRGVVKPYCIVLTETTDYEGNNAEKLETPIIIYQTSLDKSGIYVDGVFFMDQDSMEYGG